MPKRLTVEWLDKPGSDDYKSAATYLSLTIDEKAAKRIAAKLKRARMRKFKANDIFRASGLPLLPLTDSHVNKDEGKILASKPLSPILLVRAERLGRVVIADGYHRMCAVYAFDEDAIIPCKIV